MTALQRFKPIILENGQSDKQASKSLLEAIRERRGRVWLGDDGEIEHWLPEADLRCTAYLWQYRETIKPMLRKCARAQAAPKGKWRCRTVIVANRVFEILERA